MIEILQRNYVLVILSAFIALIITFIANLFKNDKHCKQSYIEAVVASMISTGLVVWVHTLAPVLEEISVAPPPF
jgi:hypothetical protein